MSVVAVCLAASSAAGFAVSTPLQHRANTLVHEDPRTTGGGLGALIRRPWWVAGQILAMVAFALHAVALHFGALILVQPIVVSGIVLAVPVRAALGRRMPRRDELATVTLTAAGLGLFIVAAQPDSGSHTAGWPISLGATTAGVVAAAGAATWAGYRHGVPRASGYGLACGVLFGVTGGLVKLVGAHAASTQGVGAHAWSLISTWPAWAAVVTGLSGVVLNQRAYRAAPLSASMPLLNIVDVLVAIGFGFLVFGEVPAHSPLALVGAATALMLMLLGLRRLARDEDTAPADGLRPKTAFSRPARYRRDLTRATESDRPATSASDWWGSP